MTVTMKVNDKGKRRILKGHPWVFRSDLVESPAAPGVAAVTDAKGAFLGQALHSPHSQIALRMIGRGAETVDEDFWKERIEGAAALRKALKIPSDACRIVFGESDGIPSFILDRYHEAYSFQILSAGLETQREALLSCIQRIFEPAILVERNDVSVRNLEKLPLSAQILKGGGSTEIEVREGGLRFRVDLLEGQKTGAFLDQRDNRLKAAALAQGRKKILDAFSYQGWFACHMAQAAEEVTAVEQSAPACLSLRANLGLNQIGNVKIEEANAFDFLKEADLRKDRFDLINLDPPAFVKSRSQLKAALKGYKEINLRALRLLNPGGVLITSSCSHHLSEEKFLEILEDAARDARRRVQILSIGGQAPDHPVLLNFPESRYLKCFFLHVL